MDGGREEKRDDESKAEQSRADLEFSCNRVLIHVDVVFVEGGHDELIALWLHPRGDK